MTKNLEQTVAMRFRDPLGKIESTYERMMTLGRIKLDVATKHLKDNFEKLAIKANLHLKPEMIRKYLNAIPGEDNELRRQAIQDVILVNGKFLIIATLHYMFNEDPDVSHAFLAQAFETFNVEYKEYLVIFKDVSNEELIQGLDAKATDGR